VNRPRIKVAGLVALGVAMVAVGSGCDLQENADTANGRQLFIEKCGTCHYLKEAGTSGQTGPVLAGKSGPFLKLFQPDCPQRAQVRPTLPEPLAL